MNATRRQRKETQSVEKVITDLEALRIITDPLRLKILEVMAADLGRNWSAKEVARAIGTSQTKLYHHLGLMEEHGFLRVAETRLVSGIVERRYAATAQGFRVDRSLLAVGGGADAMADAVDAVLDKTRGEILAGVASGLIARAGAAEVERRMAFWATHARLRPASVRKVLRLLQRLGELDDRNEPDGEHYGLLVAFYPRADEGADR